MARRVWKSPEIAWLRENYHKLGAKACAEHFGGTTADAVIRAADRYGIARRHVGPSEWADAVIRRCHESGSPTPWLDAARALGRSRQWVNSRARHLGLRVAPENGPSWKKGEVDFVLKHLHWPTHRIAAEMQANGWRRTQDAVKQFLKRRSLSGTDTGHMSGDAVALAMGTTQPTVRRWILAGLLIAERRSPESTTDLSVAVAEEDLAAFILLNPERVNFTKLEVAQTKAWFLDLISRFPKPPSKMDTYLKRQIASLRTFRPDYDNERIATTLGIEEKTVREALSHAREVERQRARARAQRREQREAA